MPTRPKPSQLNPTAPPNLTDTRHFLFTRPLSNTTTRSRVQLKLEELPDSVTEEMLKSDEAFLRAFHHILLEVRPDL